MGAKGFPKAIPNWSRPIATPLLRTARCRVDCAAKLNLFLEILGKRVDGYHELETVMVAVDRFDTLEFTGNTAPVCEVHCGWVSGWQRSSPGRDPSALEASMGDLPQGSANIVWRVVEQLRLAAGVEQGATIHVTKRIPSLSGLGGASSDAAGALLAANHVWKLGWSRPRLAEFAADFGSDIPFFFSVAEQGPCLAMARGRGERIELLAGVGSLHAVVVRPPEGLSTPAVYQRCQVPTEPIAAEPLVDAVRTGQMNQVGKQLFNRLQPAACQLSPWIARMQAAFGKLDCWGHAMSGSGSSYFGLCRNRRHAQHLMTRLRALRLGHVFRVAAVSAPCRLVDTTSGTTA